MQQNSPDNRPIGVFDSGLGGLTVVKEIQKQLPGESIIYVGDTARVPYGNRSQETITEFSREIVSFLKDQQVKAIVIACASASSAAAATLRLENPDLPIYDVISPFARNLDLEQASQIGVIGTRATISSGLLASTIQDHHPEASIRVQACPLFVPIIEEGIISGTLIEQTISLYLQAWQPKPPSHLILGCTHYPLIADSLQAHFPSTQIVHPGTLLANLLEAEIIAGRISPNQKNPLHHYFITDMNESFQKMAEMFLGTPLSIEKIDLSEPPRE